MKPTDFYIVAARLLQDDHPYFTRSALSRTYYGLFHVAASALRSVGIDIPKGPQAHGLVPECLLNSGNPSLCSIGSALAALKGDRNKADYALDLADKSVEDRRTVQMTLNRARQWTTTIENAMRGPEGAAITGAIRKWRASVNQ